MQNGKCASKGTKENLQEGWFDQKQEGVDPIPSRMDPLDKNNPHSTSPNQLGYA